MHFTVAVHVVNLISRQSLFHLEYSYTGELRGDERFVLHIH